MFLVLEFSFRHIVIEESDDFILMMVKFHVNQFCCAEIEWNLVEKVFVSAVRTHDTSRIQRGSTVSCTS